MISNWETGKCWVSLQQLGGNPQQSFANFIKRKNTAVRDSYNLDTLFVLCFARLQFRDFVEAIFRETIFAILIDKK